MYNETLAYVTSFCAMFLTFSSYFCKKKSMYLFFQFTAIIFLILSYLFSLEYVAMIGISIGLIRTLTFFIYEQKGLVAPLYWPFIFSVLTIIAYFVGSELKGDARSYYDILYIIGLIIFAFAFRIRDIRIVRYLSLPALAISALYNLLIHAPIFTTLDYTFELIANIVAIVIYSNIFSKTQIIPIKKENTDENN